MNENRGPACGPVEGPSAVVPLGSRALLLRVDAGLVRAVRRQLLAEPLAGQQEVTAGATSLVVRFESARAARAARSGLAALRCSPEEAGSGELITIDTVYAGEDLDEVGRLTGLGVDGVIRVHTEQEWQVAFVGFAPGFAYLRGGDERLHVPRRSTPRVTVPAGSVALAGPFSAVYPRSSPGGWQLIGDTSAQLWTLDRQPPTRLEPGTRVRFRAVRERIQLPDEPDQVRLPAAGECGLRVLAPGLQSLIEDTGRPGLSAWGVSRSGAADLASLRQANRLVGNEPGLAGIETAAGGLRLEAAGDQVLAVTGAVVTLTVHASDGDHEIVQCTPFALRSGAVLELGPPRAGLRSYVAVRGGIEAPVILGSRSTDLLAGLGVPALAPGDFLPVGPDPRAAVGQPEPPVSDMSADCAELGVVLGPDDDWFDAESIEVFLGQEWAVTPQSNRVGIRLAGEPVPRRPGELESQGLVPGAIQVPPSGQPVLFLADHPATGGYPVIGVLADRDLDRAAQLPIGARVRFHLERRQ